MTEKYTLSLDQMKELRALDIDTEDASMVKIFYDYEGNEIDPNAVNGDETEWVDDDMATQKISSVAILDAENGDYDHSYRESNGVYTLQDILRKLPATIVIDNNKYELHVIKFSTSWNIMYVHIVDRNKRNVHNMCCRNNLIDAAFLSLLFLLRKRYKVDDDNVWIINN